VNALERMWAALRPDGLLLDIRPAQQRPLVEVRWGESAVTVGQVNDLYRFETLRVADDALQTLVDARRFTREREVDFGFVYHFESVDAWLEYMSEHWNSAVLNADLIVRARDALLPGAEGELRIQRIIHAACLRRLHR
jgi:hypothetical protein